MWWESLVLRKAEKRLHPYKVQAQSLRQVPSSEYEAYLPRIKKCYEKAAYWHGTGRFKYSESGEVIDLLKQILTDNALRPHLDDIDWKRGAIQSVSLARSRMYGRLYAGLFSPFGKGIGNAYGSPRFWSWYFVNTLSVVGFFEHWPPGKFIPDYPARIARWIRKVSKEEDLLFKAFRKGSDIPTNYPILIGIKRGVVHPTQSARFISLHECRTEEPILLNDMTHMEVPADKVFETRDLLRIAGNSSLPVIPIEYGEQYCRQFSFWRLVSGRPLE